MSRRQSVGKLFGVSFVGKTSAGVVEDFLKRLEQETDIRWGGELYPKGNKPTEYTSAYMVDVLYSIDGELFASWNVLVDGLDNVTLMSEDRFIMEVNRREKANG